MVLQDAELPSNTTVESTNEGDEHNDVFVSYFDEANVETNPTDSFGESSLSSNASADDDGEGLSDTAKQVHPLIQPQHQDHLVNNQNHYQLVCIYSSC